MKNAITSKPIKAQSSRLWWYLLLVIALSAFCYITLDVLLLPYSVEYSETGKMTAGYFLYAAIGLLFSTPTPFAAVLILSLLFTTFLPGKWAAKRGRIRLFRRLIAFDQDPFCVPRQHLPLSKNPLISMVCRRVHPPFTPFLHHFRSTFEKDCLICARIKRQIAAA